MVKLLVVEDNKLNRNMPSRRLNRNAGGTDARTRSMPVTALTARALGSDRERMLVADRDDYDRKPVEVGRLVWMITNLIDNKATT